MKQLVKTFFSVKIFILAFVLTPNLDLSAQTTDCDEIKKIVDRIYMQKVRSPWYRKHIRNMDSKAEKEAYRKDLKERLQKRYGFSCYDSGNPNQKPQNMNCADVKDFVDIVYIQKFRSPYYRKRYKALSSAKEKETFKEDLKQKVIKQYGMDCTNL